MLLLSSTPRRFHRGVHSYNHSCRVRRCGAPLCATDCERPANWLVYSYWPLVVAQPNRTGCSSGSTIVSTVERSQPFAFACSQPLRHETLAPMTTKRRIRRSTLPIALLLYLALLTTLVTPGAIATSRAGCTPGWQLVTSPASMENLESISMTGPYDAWAVGSTQVDGVLRTRTVRISDGVWNVVPSPNVEVGDSLENNQLHGVAAVATSAFAVGGRTNNRGKAKPIAMRWTGTEWLVTRVPRPTRRREPSSST